MKTFLIAFAGALFCRSPAFANSGAITGPANVNLAGISQDLYYQPISARTNIVGTQTNYSFVLKSTTTNFTVDADWLLARLTNSFSTNFPAGSQLLLTGNGPGYGFRVVDTTGTNFSFDPSAVLSASAPSAYLYSGVQNLTTANIDTKVPVGGNDTELITSVFTIGFNDYGMATTADGTHSAFGGTCLAQSKSSENFANGGSFNANVTITFIGSGEVGTNDAIFNGTIRAKTTYPASP